MYLCIYQSIHGLSGLAVYWQKCKLTMGCATRTSAHVQLIASFPWTPVRRASYSHPQSIHRDVRVGLWNYIRFAAGYGPTLYLSLLPGVFVALPVTPSLRVHYTVRWHLRAGLIVCLGACSREPRLTKPCFGCRVFHGKLFTK
jgi:hypothetical protein